MTWSLKLRNGDLALGTGRYASVSGSDKLVQDLRNHILERMGNDDMHPDFGSLIDGGITPEGRVKEGLIGGVNDEFTLLQIEVEIRRIIREHQARQLERAKDDRLVYGKATFNRGEVLIALSNVHVERTEDTLKLNLTLATADEAEEDLIFPISIPIS